MFSIVALIFVSGVFKFADIFGVRLFLQMFFSVPVLLFFVYRIFQNPKSFFHFIILYALIKLVLELVWRANVNYILENGLLIMALFIVLSSKDSEFSLLVNSLIQIATFFALLALIQWLVSFFINDLVQNSMEFTESGELLKGDNNFFSYLGFFSPKQYTILGHAVARHQSFAKEPSLVLIFFYLPSCIALLFNYKKYRIHFWIIIVFSVLSFSGSIMLALGLSFLFVFLVKVINIKMIFPSGLIFLMLFYLSYVKNSGLDVLLSFFLDLGSKNDLLAKTASISDRALPAVDNWKSVISSPIGQAQLSDATGPWLVNSGLATGWLGVLMLILFLYRLSNEMRKLQIMNFAKENIGLSLLLGSLSVFIIFNDYQMSSYSGLLLITILYRVLIYRNNEYKLIGVK